MGPAPGIIRCRLHCFEPRGHRRTRWEEQHGGSRLARQATGLPFRHWVPRSPRQSQGVMGNQAHVQSPPSTSPRAPSGVLWVRPHPQHCKTPWDGLAGRRELQRPCPVGEPGSGLLRVLVCSEAGMRSWAQGDWLELVQFPGAQTQSCCGPMGTEIPLASEGIGVIGPACPSAHGPAAMESTQALVELGMRPGQGPGLPVHSDHHRDS